MYYHDLFNLFEYFPLLWIASIIATPIIAGNKKRNAILWLLLAIPLGPLALFIIAVMPKPDGAKGDPSGLDARISDLERRVWRIEHAAMPHPESPQQVRPEPVPAPAPVIPAAPRQKKEGHDLEQKMGRYWLNRIGILVLAMGVAFLVSYTFKYFGPFVKILTGYLIASALFITGFRLERKQKYVYYGRTLLGGAWAIAYFTTYAMYHFPASRIIHSQLLDLVLLAVVAVAMLLRSLRYKSQELSSVALFVGYFTATMGDINYFTLASCLMLAVISVILVYKMRWLRMIFVGIALTYLTHIFWVVKQVKLSYVPIGQLDVSQVQFWLNNGFVFLYWLVFTVSIYMIRNPVEREEKQLAAANFSNFLPFFVLAYSRIYVEYPEWKFPFVLGLGIVYSALAFISSRAKNGIMTTVNTLIALSLVTFSIPLMAVPLSTTIIWLVELPCIIYIGQRFGKKAFRIFALLLSLVVFFRVATFDFAISKDLVLLIGALSSFMSVFVARRIKGNDTFRGEKFLVNAYSLFGTIYLTTLLWNKVPGAWLGTALFEEVFALALAACLLKDRAFRAYSYILVIVASIVLFFTGTGNNFIWVIVQVPALLFIGLRYKMRPVRVIALASAAALFMRACWADSRMIAFAGMAAMYMCDCLNRYVKQEARFGGEYPLIKVYSALGTAYLTFFLWYVVPLRWLTLALASEMAALFVAARIIKDAYFRAYSLVLLLMVSFRMVFVGGGRVFDAANWAVFAVEAAMMAFVYLSYRGLKNRNEISEIEKPAPTAIFVIAALALTFVIFDNVERNLISLVLGVEGAAMFALGFAAKDKASRIGGFAVFGITLARIVIVDMAHVAVIYKIISFMALGAIFMVTSFLYNKYNIGREK